MSDPKVPPMKIKLIGRSGESDSPIFFAESLGENVSPRPSPSYLDSMSHPNISFCSLTVGDGGLRQRHQRQEVTTERLEIPQLAVWLLDGFYWE